MTQLISSHFVPQAIRMSTFVTIDGANWSCSLCNQSGGNHMSYRHVAGPRHKKNVAKLQESLATSSNSSASNSQSASSNATGAASTPTSNAAAVLASTLVTTTATTAASTALTVPTTAVQPPRFVSP